MQPLVFMLMNISYLSGIIFLTFHSFNNDVERIYLSRNLNDMQKNIWKLCNVSSFIIFVFCLFHLKLWNKSDFLYIYGCVWDVFWYMRMYDYVNTVLEEKLVIGC